jgi:hypothetical protein
MMRFGIYKKTVGVPFPGEYWDGSWDEENTRHIFIKKYEDRQPDGTPCVVQDFHIWPVGYVPARCARSIALHGVRTSRSSDRLPMLSPRWEVKDHSMCRLDEVADAILALEGNADAWIVPRPCRVVSLGSLAVAALRRAESLVPPVNCLWHGTYLEAAALLRDGWRPKGWRP